VTYEKETDKLFPYNKQTLNSHATIYC